MIIALAVGILQIVAMWKLFNKAGKPGWASIVPVYNIIVNQIVTRRNRNVVEIAL